MYLQRDVDIFPGFSVLVLSLVSVHVYARVCIRVFLCVPMCLYSPRVCGSFLPRTLISSVCMSVCMYLCVFWYGFNPPELGIQSQPTFHRSSILVLVLVQYSQQYLGVPRMSVYISYVCECLDRPSSFSSRTPSGLRAASRFTACVDDHTHERGTSIHPIGALFCHFC